MGDRLSRLFRGALFRLQTHGLTGLLVYIFTRFWTVRQAMRWVKARRSRPAAARRDTSLFARTDAELLGTQLIRDGYCEGLSLPDAQVREIVAFAEQAECTQYTGYGMSGTPITFRANEWREAERASGLRLAMGRIRWPSRSCEAVRQIQSDPFLLDLVARGLGYEVSYVESRLYWSFARHDLDQQSRSDLGQNVHFHYDLHKAHPAIVFVQFYLTDVGPSDGPLELIPGSHRAKPWRFLLGSANQSDARIQKAYGAEAVRRMVGPAGTGFAMDGFCMHRATPPGARDRLMLQLRIA